MKIIEVNLGIYIWVRVRGTWGNRGTQGYHMRIPLQNHFLNPPTPDNFVLVCTIEELATLGSINAPIRMIVTSKRAKYLNLVWNSGLANRHAREYRQCQQQR
jgi:hypothetical protein